MKTICGLLPLLCGLALPAASGADAFPGRVEGRAYAIDGDTLSVNGHRIRLAGADAPEAGQTCGQSAKPWPCGAQAARVLVKMIGRQTVSCSIKTRDRHRRLVGVCGTPANGDLGAAMIGAGWATHYSAGRITPRTPYYALLEVAARVKRRNIWSGRFTRPHHWRAARRR